jgi:hypothetical protein
MSSIAAAALRFVAAIAIGLFLLFLLVCAQFVLVLMGVIGPSLSGPVLVFGMVLIVASAARWAITAKATIFDRAAGTVAATVPAAVFAGVGMVAAVAVIVVLVVSVLFIIAGRLDTAFGLFLPINATASLVGAAAMLCAAALAYAIYRIWSPLRARRTE